ncbi:hypothetical protein [Azohydromonas australica]|uniref:hypothetical protein n=1 Tax=Azohydromonas australica TaxID=364039 RepID=UPI0012EBF645|nr:hypothetical protein [Azohydromonas australica]
MIHDIQAHCASGRAGDKSGDPEKACAGNIGRHAGKDSEYGLEGRSGLLFRAGGAIDAASYSKARGCALKLWTTQ